MKQIERFDFQSHPRSRSKSQSSNTLLILGYVYQTPAKMTPLPHGGNFLQIFVKTLSLNLHRNIRCKMFRILTHFDVFAWFGGNIHCLPIRVGCSSNFVGFKRAIVLGKCGKPFASVSSSFWTSMWVTMLLAMSLLPHFIFAQKFSKCKYWTGRTAGPLVLFWFLCARSTKAAAPSQ